MRKTTTLLALFISALICTSSAQPGTLDPDFGAAGIQLLAPSTSHDVAHEVIALADTTLLACGVTFVNGEPTAFIAHLLQDGTLDTGYGTSAGYTFFDAGQETYAYDMELATDGSVYMCGTAYPTFNQQTVALMHVDANGTPDANFGTNGLVITAITGVDAEAQDMALDTGGKVVLAGRAGFGPSSNSLLLRYGSTGVLDNSFSGDGELIITAYGSEDQAYAVDILDDGSIIAVGYADLIGDQKTILIKIDVNGVPVPAFGGDGVIVPNFPWTANQAWAVEAYAQRFFVAGVDQDVQNNYNAYIALFNHDGSFDSGFGTSGYTTTDIDQNDHAFDIALQADGKVFVCGTTGDLGFGAERDFLVARYTTTGQLDATFGTGGTVVTSIGNAWADANGMDQQVDGKVVCAGFRAGTNNDVAIARYLNDLNVGMVGSPLNGNNVLVYPNPALDQLLFAGGVGAGARARILDTTGRTVLNVPVEAGVVGVSQLAPGHYLMELVSEASVRTIPFVKE